MKTKKRSAYHSSGVAVCAGAVLLLASPVSSRADNLFVTTGYSTILEFNSSGVGTVFASTGTSLPGSLTFDSAGNLYVVCVGNNGNGNSFIEKFDSSGVGTVFASSGLYNPRGLACDSAGNLYVANLGNGTIERFNSSGVGTVFASGLALPNALAFDSAGNLYVANGNTTALAFDSVGNLYEANYPSGTIEKFNSSGVGTVFASSSSGTYAPWALAIDSADNLYVANFEYNTIEEFNSSGVGTVFASQLSTPGLADPGGLAFQPAPEPSSWAILGMGSIALLFVKRQRAFRPGGRPV